MKRSARLRDFVAFTKQNNGGLIKPKRAVDLDHDVLTRAEAKKVRSGIKQIKEGRFELWRDLKRELGRRRPTTV